MAQETEEERKKRLLALMRGEAAPTLAPSATTPTA